ncbi:MAG: hypothetical protein NCW75_03685 [Phycisphaera sp.]|nr:MAG: hypothetical protein NCW75_03685 [Phycisphaera sp.]
MDPWFTEQTAGMVGTIIGVGLGAGFGGIGGGVGGPLAGMGKAKGFVLGIFALGLLIGIGLALTGLVALVMGQPWHVWFVFLAPGVTCALIFGMLLPVIRAQYARAEQRKVDAAAIRGA